MWGHGMTLGLPNSAPLGRSNHAPLGLPNSAPLGLAHHARNPDQTRGFHATGASTRHGMTLGWGNYHHQHTQGRCPVLSNSAPLGLSNHAPLGLPNHAPLGLSHNAPLGLPNSAPLGLAHRTRNPDQHTQGRCPMLPNSAPLGLGCALPDSNDVGASVMIYLLTRRQRDAKSHV